MGRVLRCAALAVVGLIAGSCALSKAPAAGTAIPVASAPPAASSSTPAATPSVARPAALVAVTSSGDVVALDPGTGAVRRTLAHTTAEAKNQQLPSIALDRVHQMVYYDALTASTCFGPQVGTIWKVPLSGGTPTQVADGTVPTVSDDGTKLAFVTNTCGSSAGKYTSEIHVRDIATGTDHTLPDPVPGASGLPPAPVPALSLSSNGSELAVTTDSVEDSEGQNVWVVGTTNGTATPVPFVPIVANQQHEYDFNAAYTLDGSLFVNQFCCEGIQGGNVSSRLATIDASTGKLVHLVAVGDPNKTHRSLSADSSGSWLLYVSGTDLEVSYAYAKPSVLAHDIWAASW